MSRRTREPASLPAPENIDRLPPHSIEAEQGTLGCILIDPRGSMPRAMERLAIGAEVFYDLRHQTLFDHMTDMFRAMKPIDLVTLHESLKEKNQLEALGGLPYLSALQEAVPSAANLDYYVDILLEKYTCRKIIGSCQTAICMGYETDVKPAKMLSEVSTVINKLNLFFNGEKTADVRTLVHEVITEYEREGREGGKIVGLETGIIDYDRLTGGLRPGEMMVLAARPSMGKSSLAMNIVDHVTVNLGKPAGVFSLEMPAKDLIDRMVCARAQVNRKHIRDGLLAERDYPKLTGAAGKIANAPIYIDDTAHQTELTLRSRAMRWKDEHKIELLVLDYLQFMKHSEAKRGDRFDEIGKVSNAIKGLLKDLGIPGVILCQMNRDIEREKTRKPRLSDLRESGNIEQDADTIGFLYKPGSEEEDEEEQWKEAIAVNWLIGKQRNGPTGEVHLTFFKSFTKFENAAKIADEPQRTML